MYLKLTDTMRTSETTFFDTDNKRVQVSQRQFVFAKSIKLILRNDLRHFFFFGVGGGCRGLDVTSIREHDVSVFRIYLCLWERLRK